MVTQDHLDSQNKIQVNTLKSHNWDSKVINHTKIVIFNILPSVIKHLKAQKKDILTMEGNRELTFPMHFSKCGANLPAMIDRPQFMQSKISLATAGCVWPKMSTTYLLFASPLLFESATLTRAWAESLSSSSSSSKFRSSPSLAMRWHSEAMSRITESNRSE